MSSGTHLVGSVLGGVPVQVTWKNNEEESSQNIMHISGGFIYITFYTFSRRFHPKRLTTVNTHIDTPTAESTTRGDSQLVRSS